MKSFDITPGRIKARALNIISMVIIAVSVLISGCADDFLDYDGLPIEYPEGETTVNFHLDFEPFAESSSETSTRSLNGKSMDLLDDFCLLAYDLDGNLMEGFPIMITKKDHKLEVTRKDREDSDASNGHKSEKYTRHAEFKVTVPYGNYYLYGVANLGERDENGKIVKTTLEALGEGTLAEDIKKRTGLLNHKRQWDTTNPLNNFEMLGNFTNKEHKQAPQTGEDMNGLRVSVERPEMELHCWLRRCVSKVTIDFDGSGLRENIKVHIRRATIHDIPRTCALGAQNAATSAAEIHTFKNNEYRPVDTADDIIYGNGDDYTAWPYISKGSDGLVINAATRDFEAGSEAPDYHNESSPSLFLYENMQGDTEDDKTNKVQKPTNDGLVVGADEMKDEVEFGSYIEVEGYYDYNSKAEVSQGKIIYRFMLGKDELKNFDVERNYHIKLTMKVRGNGNDVDWHIEYDRKSGFEWRDPYYVSYVYNHDSTLHFRYTPPANRKVVKISAEIVGNNWWPEDPGSPYFEDAVNAQSPFTEKERALNDLTEASFTHNKYPEGSGELTGKTKYLGNGFLSLWPTDKEVLTFADNDVPSKDWAKNTDNHMMNDRYFYGITSQSGEEKEKVNRAYREYDINKASGVNQEGRDGYTVEKYPDGSMRFNIPVFTRAKNIVKQSAYTGNNPFEGSRRIAYIRVVVTHDDGWEDDQVMRVVQVPRITNPKGIYRSSGNNEDFSVKLLQRSTGSSDIFTPFRSDGPWMAEVLGDHNFINLNGKTTIKGGTGSYVEFNVHFNKMNRDKKVRNAVIRVRYHNYTCVHLIFVRQGYKPQALYPGGAVWHTCNMIHGELEAEDPRDEGSLFKYGNINDPIDVKSNEQPWSIMTIPANVGDFKPAGNLYLANSDGSLRRDPNNPDKIAGFTWSSIKGDMSSNAFSQIGVATIDHIRQLIVSPSDVTAGNINSKMAHGFGVLYADGATTVQTSVEKAYGYYRRRTTADAKTYGMQGVFVYYWNSKNEKDPNNCRSIFFPIGRSGHGHRRSNDRMTGSKDDSGDGTLRYCAGRNAGMGHDDALYMPLFYDLWRRPGAIYWAASPQDKTGVDDANVQEALALDLNYYTLDVNMLPRTNLQKHSQWTGCHDQECIDACFVRKVGE